VVVFLIKEKMDFISFLPVDKRISEIISSCGFFIIPVILTGISIVIAKWLPNETVQNSIIQVEQANNAFLPSYLGYFFVALSIEDFYTMIFMFIILFIFTFFSQTLYFNPLFLLWGFQFFYFTKEDNVKIFVITREKIITPDDIELNDLRRINDYTFIDLGGKK
jgi:hypothetical protein